MFFYSFIVQTDVKIFHLIYSFNPVKSIKISFLSSLMRVDLIKTPFIFRNTKLSASTISAALNAHHGNLPHQNGTSHNNNVSF